MQREKGISIKTPENLLTQEEMEILLEKTKNGCQKSREHLISNNLKLVLTICHRLKRGNHSFEDLFQIGTIGLIKAIDNFDLSKGFQFSTYAVPMIMGEIKRFIRDDKPMRVSRGLKEKAQKILKFKEEFEKKNQREPRLSEIEEELGLKKEDVVWALEATRDLISMNQSVGNEQDDGEEITVEMKIADKEDWEEKWENREIIRDAFKNLSQQEKAVIQMRYFEDKTQMEIGSEIGVSQAHISRIERGALKKMKRVV